jgi:hypothetical protein
VQRLPGGARAASGEATLWMAVAADMGGSLLVVANGLRARRALRLPTSAVGRLVPRESDLTRSTTPERKLSDATRTRSALEG